MPTRPRGASLHHEIEDRERVDAAIRKLPIKVTTIQSSKGLAADLVVIAYFDDKYFIKHADQGITDNDVCNFLVALTRARKKVVFISTEKADPTFLGWIDPKRIERK
jgi:superfamily I DNA/RNA helicase